MENVNNTVSQAERTYELRFRSLSVAGQQFCTVTCSDIAAVVNGYQSGGAFDLYMQEVPTTR